MTILACCIAPPRVSESIEDAGSTKATSGKEPGPNAKIVESLSHSPLQISACAGSPAEAPTVNARLLQRASLDSASSMYGGLDYACIIEADLVGCEQLEVPANVYTEHTAHGHAYPAQLGAPLPAANDARVATLMSIGPVGDPPPPEIAPILRLAINILGVGSIMVSLLDGEKKFVVKSAAGFVPPETMLTPPGICHWSLVPQVHQMVVIEDTLLDARTQQNSIVAGPPGIRFYCGAPLVASNGHRLGMLCAADQHPHPFDKERAGILCNLSEMVVRQLEASWAEEYQRKHSRTLLRAMTCYTEPCIFADVSAPGWSIMHINEAVTEQTGITRDDITSKSFWDLFGLKSTSVEPWKAYEKVAAEGSTFAIEGARSTAASAPAKRTFNMLLRPADKDCALDGSLMIGVPAGSFSLPERRLSYYLVTLRPGTARLSAERQLPFEGLQLGQQLGRGSYGRVYRGLYKGQKVAVKVVEDASLVRKLKDGRPVEAALTDGLSHPGVVKLLEHKTVPTQHQRRASLDGGSRVEARGGDHAAGPRRRRSCDGADGKRAAPESELWLILEYCDKGTVQDAVDKGWFREAPNIDAPPCLPTILQTAQQIAAAMAHLHDRGVCHGDLTGGNVLLQSAPGSAHGFAAKVADFGLVRDFSVVSRLQTRTYGTVTHMAPEVLSSDTLSRAADVYSFGVVLWELCAGQRAWASLNFAQVIHVVAIENKALQPPEKTPPQLAELMRTCMAHDPAKRPTFASLLTSLNSMATELAGTVSIPAQ